MTTFFPPAIIANMNNLVFFPSQSLITPASPITSFDSDLKLLALDMLAIMTSKNGVGLAANQIGSKANVFVMHCDKDVEPYIFINPEISSFSLEKMDWPEGCLSFPGLRLDISRHKSVSLKWQDLTGNYHEKSFADLEAVCVQHELDHLNGITFTDRLGSVKKHMALKKYLKLKK